MPLIGDHSDFPLPEVLMLIGARSGRLTIFEVPILDKLQIDLSEGEAHSMYVGHQTLTDADHIVANLSAVVQVQTCRFEFRSQKVPLVKRENPLTINHLVMSLVYYVDQQVAQQKAIDEARENPSILMQEEISRKSNDFTRAANAAKEIRRLTSRLPHIDPPARK